MPVPPIAVRSSTVTFSGEATRGKKVVVVEQLLPKQLQMLIPIKRVLNATL